MKRIEHKGRVSKVGTDRIFVTVVSHSACAGCHARQVCSSGDTEEKIIEVLRENRSEEFREGEEVTVCISSGSGVLAVMLAYVFPLLVLLSALSVCAAIGFSDHLNALISIAFLFLYFIILFTFRRKLNGKINVKIEKQ